MIERRHITGLFFLSAIIVVAAFNLFSFSGTLAGFWVSQTNSGQRNWQDIAISSDGAKIAAVSSGSGFVDGGIYTSSDSGATWTHQVAAGPGDWKKIVSSSNGSKLLALLENQGFIYVSTDSGENWTTLDNGGNRKWTSVAMTADGTKIAATELTPEFEGYVYTSVDGGTTWIEQTDIGTRFWYDVTVSADGSKLLAIGESVVFLSEDFGDTWTELTLPLEYYDGESYGNAISADGTIIYLAGGVYISTDGGDTWEVNQNPPSSSIYFDGDPALIFQMSGDGQKIFAAGSEAAYLSADGGLHWTTDTTFPNPVARSIAVSSDGSVAYLVRASTHVQKALITGVAPVLTITSPASDELVSSWSPIIDWGTSLRCEYSYNNASFTATTCLDASGLLPPLGGASQTLYIRGVNITGTSTLSRAFRYPYEQPVWATRVNSLDGSWAAVATSANGEKVVAAIKGGRIYTSVDKGVTWTEQTGSAVKEWARLASSADGTKLFAVSYSSSGVFTSTDSGVTWVEQLGAGAHAWFDIAVSSDGTKVVASNSDNVLVTSTDGGETWTEQSGVSNPRQLASSSDGLRLVATTADGTLYVSTDGGETWTDRTPSGSVTDVASSSDGLRLVAISNARYVYTSTDGGETWTDTDLGSGTMYGVTSSGNGVRLAIINLRTVRTSENGGTTWVTQTTAPVLVGDERFTDITSSSDGTIIHLSSSLPFQDEG